MYGLGRSCEAWRRPRLRCAPGGTPVLAGEPVDRSSDERLDMESSNGPSTITIAAALAEEVTAAAVDVREAVQRGDDRDDVLSRVQTLTSSLEKALENARTEAVEQQSELTVHVEGVDVFVTRLIDALAGDADVAQDIDTTTGGAPTARPLRSS